MNNMGIEASGASHPSVFEQYLLAEYSHIANAHFKTIDTISTFFKHYLVIMSIPISVIALILSGQYATDELAKITVPSGPVSFLLAAIAWAGFGVLLYIINLRLDAMLYARTINGIRKYFYDRGEVDIHSKLRMRVLPQSPQMPNYFEKGYFLPVVFVFAIINTSYFCLAWYTMGIHGWRSVLVYTLTAIVFGGIHFLSYYLYAGYRKHSYLRSCIIGVDIDGVLNRHREQFCKLLERQVGKKINPDAITTIPVHECDNIGVTREDEKKVFNDPEYWITMPVADGAADNLRRLRNSFNFKVYIFTHRPWPVKAGMDAAQRKRMTTAWTEAVRSFEREVHGGFFFRTEPIEHITKLWLLKHGFKYDDIMVEQCSDDISYPRGRFRNRFYESRKKCIKFFVEDDIRKAIKLAYICDVVFLLDQPYNRCTEGVPNNVMRVNSWDEIYRKVRALS